MGQDIKVNAFICKVSSAEMIWAKHYIHNNDFTWRCDNELDHSSNAVAKAHIRNACPSLREVKMDQMQVDIGSLL